MLGPRSVAIDSPPRMPAVAFAWQNGRLTTKSLGLIAEPGGYQPLISWARLIVVVAVVRLLPPGSS